jgi:pyrroline-5-carboxylate reductase
LRLGIIGAGAMGEAVLAAVLKAGLVQAGEVDMAERYPQRATEVAARYGVRVTSDTEAVAKSSDYLVLAVKPQDFESAAAAIRGNLRAPATVISIMAGVPIERLAGGLSHQALVRSMPNTPAQVGQGMTLWTCTSAVSEEAREQVALIFQALGRQAFVSEERYLDMATALSGSGPAYVFLFIEALIDAGVHIGLGRDLATDVAIQTVAGSALYAQEMGRHPVELRNLVTSPAGTTAEGLRALEAAGFRSAITEAVLAAYNRSRALGKGEPG